MAGRVLGDEGGGPGLRRGRGQRPYGDVYVLRVGGAGIPPEFVHVPILRVVEDMLGDGGGVVIGHGVGHRPGAVRQLRQVPVPDDIFADPPQLDYVAVNATVGDLVHGVGDIGEVFAIRVAGDEVAHGVARR